MAIFQLTKTSNFPDPNLAETEGLLAYGGDLSLERLLSAYSKGIFPWYSDGDPILWWSPDPRCVMYPNYLKVSRSMRQLFKKAPFEVTFDKNFNRVIEQCKSISRMGQEGTWITDEMMAAYCDLHRSGYAHSVEVWENDNLVGGLYGVSLGKCFFGESMFALKTDASKYGFISLVEILKTHKFRLIDCQVSTNHLISMGAIEIARTQFIDELDKCLKSESMIGDWGSQFKASGNI